jgi:hypothetical protein
MADRDMSLEHSLRKMNKHSIFIVVPAITATYSTFNLPVGDTPDASSAFFPLVAAASLTSMAKA